jgi:hypothetical protein
MRSEKNHQKQPPIRNTGEASSSSVYKFKKTQWEAKNVVFSRKIRMRLVKIEKFFRKRYNKSDVSATRRWRKDLELNQIKSWVIYWC